MRWQSYYHCFIQNLIYLGFPHVSVIQGNSQHKNSLENCTNNTIRLLSSVGRTDVPVYKGAEFSLKSIRAKTDVHGS